MRFSEFKTTISEQYFPANFPPLRPGARGDAVVKYQQALNKFTEKDIEVDGQFGPATTAATKEVQQALNLPTDGIPGPQTYGAINRALETGVSTGFGKMVRTGSGGMLTAPGSAPAVTTKSTQDKPVQKVIKNGPGWNVVQTQDGDVQKRVGNRPWRNNNPGNIEYGPFTRSKGAIGTDGRFAIFPTAEMGVDAKKDLLFNPRSAYINLTLRDAIYKYAPPGENDTEGYLKNMIAATGVPPNTPMKNFTEEQRNKLVLAMARQEGYVVGKIQPVTGRDLA